MRYTPKQLAELLIDLCETKQQSVSDITDAFISLMAEHQYMEQLRDVVEAIESVWKERYGAATITIESAHPLTTALKKKLSALAKGAELKEVVDGSLIGGARVRIDDRIIDGSIAGYLSQLKHTWNAS